MSSEGINEQESSSMNAETRQNDVKQVKERFGVLGLFVEDSSGKVYGVTAKHVSLYAGVNVLIKKMSKNGQEMEEIHIGKAVNIGDSTSKDIGLIEVDERMKDRTSNQIHSSCNSISLHSSNITDLYEKPVRKYLPRESRFEMDTRGNFNVGLLASKQEHARYFGDEVLKDHFLVYTENKQFSFPGESGTIILLDQKEKDGQNILAGIISGGFNQNDKYTVCLYLSSAIQDINKYLGRELRICKNEISKRMTDVKCGVRIYFDCRNELVKPSEAINLLQFDVGEQCERLLCLEFVKADMSKLALVIRTKSNLSDEINERKLLAMNYESSPEVAAMQSGLYACDFLYSGNMKAGEEYLRRALYLMPKCDKSMLIRIFVENTTYVTWFLLLKNNPLSFKQMQDILDDALEVFHELQNEIGFPLHSLGYLHNDYSRLFMAKYDIMRRQRKGDVNKERELRDKAVEQAERGCEVFVELFNQEKSKENHTRMVLSVCQVAYCLLGCGTDFLVVESEVPKCQVRVAEIILGGLEKCTPKLNKIPLVQKLDYLLVKSDLEYRKGNVSEALKIACICFQMGMEGRFQTCLSRAYHRLEYLKKL